MDYNHPRFTLAAMILATGLLIAWTYAVSRDDGPVDLGAGLFPLPQQLLDES